MGWVKPVTSWWNKLSLRKRLALGIAAAVVILPLLIIIVLILIGPLFSPFCHLADCLGDGLHVKLIGPEMPIKYSIEVGYPGGSRKVMCDRSLGLPAPEFFEHDTCTPDGAFFEQLDSKQPSDRPLEELVVIVVADGIQMTRTVRPQYRIWMINGKHCEPLCYYGTMEFDLSGGN
jgi:hypothetical protein